MLYAVLICTDESCAEEFEAWGELEDFDDMLCEGCGCTLQRAGVLRGEPVDDRRLPAPHAPRAAAKRGLTQRRQGRGPS